MLPFSVLDDHVEVTEGRIAISTMQLAKGLEFRAVVVMACDDEVIPLQERIQSVADDADLQEVYDTERNLLYVVCTRARDHLLVTSVEPASEFLDDLRAKWIVDHWQARRCCPAFIRFVLFLSIRDRDETISTTSIAPAADSETIVKVDQQKGQSRILVGASSISRLSRNVLCCDNRFTSQAEYTPALRLRLC